MMKILEKLSMIFCLWFLISYVEIICKNIGDTPAYSEYNLLKLVFIDYVDKISTCINFFSL